MECESWLWGIGSSLYVYTNRCAFALLSILASETASRSVWQGKNRERTRNPPVADLIRLPAPPYHIAIVLDPPRICSPSAISCSVAVTRVWVGDISFPNTKYYFQSPTSIIPCTPCISALRLYCDWGIPVHYVLLTAAVIGPRISLEVKRCLIGGSKSSAPNHSITESESLNLFLFSHF